MERLSVKGANLGSVRKKAQNICLHDSEEWNSEEMVLRTWKAAEKYSKAWNSQFTNGSVIL